MKRKIKSVILCLVGLTVVELMGQETLSTPMISKQDLIAKQEARVKELAGQMMELDASIDSRIDKVVADLKALQDSPDSGTRLTLVKQEAMKKLGNVVRFYQLERARRLTAMRTGGSYLTKDQLTNDIALIEKRIETRVDDIVGLADSFQKQIDFSQYNAFSGEQTDVSRHDRRLDARANIVQGKLEKGLDADAEKLKNENVSLKRDLLYTKGPDRELIEKQIYTNEELIQKRKQQADQNSESSTKIAEREVSAREAYRIEQSLKQAGADIKADVIKLNSLRAQYDAARNSLNLSRSMK